MKNLFVIPMDPTQTKAVFRCLGYMVLAGMLCFQNCQGIDPEESPEYRRSSEIALAWNHLALELERHTMGYRPPVSGRMYAYVEMAAYESALPGMSNQISLEKYLSGYEKPLAKFKAEQFYIPASLNAAYAQILRDFFPTAPAKLLQQIDQQEKTLSQSFREKTSTTILEQSANYGKTVAITIWNWSKTDREGHEGQLYNYDHGYIPPSCAGCWTLTGEHPSPALLPNWGSVRAFITGPNEIASKPPIAYNETPGSDFYTEAIEVFSVSQPLSKENSWIAEFWSDDLPGLTITPAGRWISIANQALKKSMPPFPTLIETYVKTGMALCDVGITVWHEKYLYNLERPETYIQAHIAPNWRSLHDTPSFPSYPSGHSAFGAAAAAVLTDALGEQFQMTDRTHENRPEFSSNPRSYGSFEEMAQENASSRVLLGVHYRMDCEEGLRIGKIVGQKMVDLPLRRKEVAVLR